MSQFEAPTGRRPPAQAKRGTTAALGKMLPPSKAEGARKRRPDATYADRRTFSLSSGERAGVRASLLLTLSNT